MLVASFQETTFKQVRNSSLGTFRVYYSFGEARAIFLPSSENDFQCQRWAVRNKLSYLDGLITVGHCLRDHGTETRNTDFDRVTRSLKLIEKDYHRAQGCVLSPQFLLFLFNH